MAAPINPFHAACAAVVADALGVDASLFQVGAPPKPDMGDFAVGCFPAAKLAKQAPPVLAKQVVDAFEPTALLQSAAAVGPFVNFRAKRTAMFEHVFGGVDIPTSVGAGKTVCVDYSSPNIAKQLGYHHIRSTVIGHALVNLYRALGFETVGINHLGDWGTTHGMLLAAQDMWGAPDPLTIDALNDMYVRFRAAMTDDNTLDAVGREWFKRLEDGDERARATWQSFRDVSLAEFQEIYDILGIQFDQIRGESEYESAMPAVIEMLEAKGLTEISEGALVVKLDDVGIKQPLLLKKRDGATLYATRDLAAALYRWDTYQFERSLYVVGRPQSLHFKQLFATLEKSGHEWAKACAHVPFGLVRVGGKKAGTRAGNAVLLKEVLDEASRLAADKIREVNADLPDDEVASIARTVGVGAIVFANLSSQRDKDVDFEWDEVVAFHGDTGPYIQYSAARCASIRRKAAHTVGAPDAALLTADLEWALAKKLCELPDAVATCIRANEPHHLCRYLLDLSGAFATWYASGNNDATLRVLCDDAPTQRARLALVDATRAVIARGLAILGIDTPERM